MNHEIDKKCKIIIDSFINSRMSRADLTYEEVLFLIVLLIKRWQYIDERKRHEWIISSIKQVKGKIEHVYITNNINIDFICKTGVSLYCINEKFENVNKLVDSFNKVVLNWSDSYIKEVKAIRKKQRVNISYENGMCCLILYMLLYSSYFAKNLKVLIKLLVDETSDYIKRDRLNLGMRYGLGGSLYTINKYSSIIGISDELHQIRTEIVELYCRYVKFEDNYMAWPAIKCANGADITCIADNWSYGPSMILYNLLNVNNYFAASLNMKNEIKLRSYLPVGDFYVIDSGFYTGDAGLVYVYDLLYKKFNDYNFLLKKYEFIQKIIDNSNGGDFFEFYKYLTVRGQIKRVIDEQKNVLKETYLIYIILSYTV